jgi:uncharacterized protein YceK
MRRRLPVLPLTIALVCLHSGCGTIFNLTDPPPPGNPGIGPTTCFPFGGVTRSAALGGCGLVFGTVGGIAEAGNGGLLGGAQLAGVGALAVLDTPLSLAGDIITFPIAYARWQGAPWATWWGEQPAPYPSQESKPLAATVGAPQAEETPAAGSSSPLSGSEKNQPPSTPANNDLPIAATLGTPAGVAGPK